MVFDKQNKEITANGNIYFRKVRRSAKKMKSVKKDRFWVMDFYKGDMLKN